MSMFDAMDVEIGDFAVVFVVDYEEGLVYHGNDLYRVVEVDAMTIDLMVRGRRETWALDEVEDVIQMPKLGRGRTWR